MEQPTIKEIMNQSNNCYRAIWHATKIKFGIDFAVQDPEFCGFMGETGEATVFTHDLPMNFGPLAIGTTRGGGKVFVIAYIREAYGVWVICREVSENTRQSVVDAYFERFEDGFSLEHPMVDGVRASQKPNTRAENRKPSRAEQAANYQRRLNIQRARRNKNKPKK